MKERKKAENPFQLRTFNLLLTANGDSYISLKTQIYKRDFQLERHDIVKIWQND